MRTKIKTFGKVRRSVQPRGVAEMTALRTGLMEVLPSETELSAAPVATFFEGDAETIIAKAEPVIAKEGRRAWIVRD